MLQLLLLLLTHQLVHLSLSCAAGPVAAGVAARPAFGAGTTGYTYRPGAVLSLGVGLRSGRSN